MLDQECPMFSRASPLHVFTMSLPGPRPRYTMLSKGLNTQSNTIFRSPLAQITGSESLYSGRREVDKTKT